MGSVSAVFMERPGREKGTEARFREIEEHPQVNSDQLCVCVCVCARARAGQTPGTSFRVSDLEGLRPGNAFFCQWDVATGGPAGLETTG